MPALWAAQQVVGSELLILALIESSRDYKHFSD